MMLMGDKQLSAKTVCYAVADNDVPHDSMLLYLGLLAFVFSFFTFKSVNI